jgi:hypothetical protein
METKKVLQAETMGVIFLKTTRKQKSAATGKEARQSGK